MRVNQQPARQERHWNQVNYLSRLIHFTPVAARIAPFREGKGVGGSGHLSGDSEEEIAIDPKKRRSFYDPKRCRSG